MASVSHVNLASIFGVESWNGQPLLMVEFLSGGTLSGRLQRGRLSRNDALDLGAALARAIAALHRSGLQHRDIKPSNIGFDHLGVPKLLDFGVATIAGPGSSSAPAGTLRYSPPEVRRGLEGGVNQDLWGLAVVVYEAMTGSHPLENDPESGKALEADVADFFRRALAFDVAKRPQSAEAMIHEIEKLMSRPREASLPARTTP